MADRINGMRSTLKNLLVQDLGSKLNWDHISTCFDDPLRPSHSLLTRLFSLAICSQPDRHVRLSWK